MFQQCIDVFCHCLPLRFCEAVEKLRPDGPAMFRNARAIPVMTDVAKRLRVMDQFPGYQQILSLASPTIESLATPQQAPELARIGNDSMAEMVAQNPDRFIGFIASLPMNNMDAALAEARRAINDRKAVGVQIYSNINGLPLDEPEFLPLFDVMAELDRPVWIHPIRPAAFADYRTEEESKYDLWWSLGWPYETSVAMLRLVHAGIFDKHPSLAIITHHVGGIMPLMEGRLRSGLRHMDGEENRASRESVVEGCKRFYADTAAFGARAPIECGLAFFGHEKLLFASDMPFDPELGPGFIRDNGQAIKQMDLTEEQRYAILAGNARRLLRLGT